MIINAFALAGRLVVWELLPRAGALGYVLLPLRGVLLKLLTHSPPAICFAYLLKACKRLRIPFARLHNICIQQ